MLPLSDGTTYTLAGWRDALKILYMGGPLTNDTDASHSGCAGLVQSGPPGSGQAGTGKGPDPNAVDARVYNLWAWKLPAGAQFYEPAVDDAGRPILGSAYWRIHESHQIAKAGSGATPCTKPDATDQVGCLVAASPCSLGYAGRAASAQNGAVAILQISKVGHRFRHSVSSRQIGDCRNTARTCANGASSWSLCVSRARVPQGGPVLVARRKLAGGGDPGADSSCVTVPRERSRSAKLEESIS